MPAKKMDADRAAMKLMPHDHACLISSNPRRWHEFVVGYLLQGVARLERCVYVTSLHGPDHMRHMLAQAHDDLKTAQDSEQLLVMHFSQVYTPTGVFEPEATVKGLRRAVAAALEMGYRGLRVTGEMQWASYRPPGYARLTQYEAMLNPFFDEQPCLAVCQYDRALFSPRLLSEIESLHHVVVEA